MVTNPLSCTTNKYGRYVVIFLNRTENKWAYMLALLSFLSVPSLKEIQLVLYDLRLPSVSTS